MVGQVVQFMLKREIFFLERAFDVQKSINIETILQKEFYSGTLDEPQLITLPNGRVFASNCNIHSTSLTLNGQNRSTLHYHNAQLQTDFKSQDYYKPKQSHRLNNLFQLSNTSLSVLNLSFDLHSESSNGDVMCAVITSSSIYITNCGFLWTGLHSLFVLQGLSLSHRTSSSITLLGCTLDNSEQRLAPIVEDICVVGGSESFDLNVVGTRVTNTKVIGADGIGMSQPSQNGISSNFEGICTTFSEISFKNVSSLPGTVRPVSPLFSQRMVGCGIWGCNNHLSGSTLRDMNGGGGFVCSNSSFNWCSTTSSERPSLSPHTPTLSSSLAPTNAPEHPAEEGDDKDDQFTGKIHDGVERFRFTVEAVTFTRCWFFNMKFTTTNYTDSASGGSALFFQSDATALTHVVQIIHAGCVYLYRAPTDIETTAEATVDSCSFTNWSSPSDRPYQYGGCVGTMNSAHNLNILNSNMTQVMGTTKLNGGFISHNTFSEVALTIDKCRMIGDEKTIGHCERAAWSHPLSGLCFGPNMSLDRHTITNTNSTKVACPFFEEVTSAPDKNKMRVGTWLPEEGFSLHSSLSAALGTLTGESLLPNIVFLSEGSHSETFALEIKHDVEIVGTGSNTTNFHCTELTTAGFKPKSGGKLTLRSMKLIPSTLSTTLVEMDEDVNLLFTRTFVEGISGQTVSLMLLTAGTTRIAHSTFQNIASERALISVSGSASLTVSDTYFITITRTSLKPPSVEATQCASCVEGMTSGEVKILFSRFGVCTTNGRAGAIDLERADDSSSVEMEWNKFDQNLAKANVDSSVKGDDIVLKNFAESQLTLNLITQQSFPSSHSFLINSSHPIIPPPGMFSLKFNGTGGPLAWADINIMKADFLSGEMTLQFLLGSRLHNNAHTSISTDFNYTETMTPFTCHNSSVSVSLHSPFNSTITVERTDNIFCQIINSTLTLKNLKLSFDNLETSAFVVDTLSSFTLDNVWFIAANPLLKAPFVFSEGKYIKIYSLTLPANLRLDDVSFVKAQNSQVCESTMTTHFRIF
ncbi:hypothetical protein BLNAU_2972 [Blattamonas nauphoetae]|uniref:Uncharacterized protein n=1 Tax=Blattamonas nauphoetae TaxID=2049346 RepID=A0ABQ9YDS5_9EUKA|nr:hypothetical protein BLNAU_2972 [Blattamonas nauphoetae]